MNAIARDEFVLTDRSMMLINSLLAHVTDDRWDEFIGELDRLNVRKAVVVCRTFKSIA